MNEFISFYWSLWLHDVTTHLSWVINKQLFTFFSQFYNTDFKIWKLLNCSIFWTTRYILHKMQANPIGYTVIIQALLFSWFWWVGRFCTSNSSDFIVKLSGNFEKCYISPCQTHFFHIYFFSENRRTHIFLRFKSQNNK